MAAEPTEPTEPPRSVRRTAPWHVTPRPVRAAGAVIGLTMLVAVLGLVFGLPAVRPSPHDLPIGVTGPLTTDQLRPQLDRVAPGGFTVTSYPDQDALRSAIRARRVYGGLVMGANGTPPVVTVLTASGASPAVAQLLTQIGTGVAQHIGATLHTEDLARVPTGDPRGAGLAASTLPLTLAGLLPAIVLLAIFPREPVLQFVTTVVFSISAAVTIAALLHDVFGSIDHNFWGVTAGLTLGILSMSLSVLGLGALFGWAGVAIGVGLAVLLGSPLSGLVDAPEMLPRSWAALGRLLPQGANATLLRSTAYFSGAGAGTAALVLTAWAVAGAVLMAIAGVRNRA